MGGGGVLGDKNKPNLKPGLGTENGYFVNFRSRDESILNTFCV